MPHTRHPARGGAMTNPRSSNSRLHMSSRRRCAPASKPLLSLAMIGCYVLQTLAQHAVINAEAWIPMANEIMMMASLARKTAENDETRPMVRSLLAGLIEVYESLVQCDEDGYIARQLNAKYERGLKQLLRDDWAEQMARLKNRIASDMMGLVLYERLKAHQK